MESGKVIFWINDTDKILNDEKPVYGIGGANVQMAFWAVTFAARGYQTFALTRNSKNRKKNLSGVRFIWHPVIRYAGIFINYFTAFFIVISYRPDYVFTRAKVKELWFVTILSKLAKFKHIHMIASDEDLTVDQQKGKNKFQLSISKLDYVVAQNKNQLLLYQKWFRNKNIPIIPNIWDTEIGAAFTTHTKKSDFIWVANFTRNKRPGLFIEMAGLLPQYSFCMIGSPFDLNLYNQCKEAVDQLPNIEIVGYKSLFETNSFIAQSKILVCTSVIEGFPNTFLQALSVNVPLLSTVDPSNFISENNIGEFCKSEELVLKASQIIRNKEKYKAYQNSIQSYFKNIHSPEANFNILQNYLGQTIHENNNTFF